MSTQIAWGDEPEPEPSAWVIQGSNVDGTDWARVYFNASLGQLNRMGATIYATKAEAERVLETHPRFNSLADQHRAAKPEQIFRVVPHP